MKAISVKHMNDIILRYSDEIRVEKNKKAKARLEDEQAMFKFVLRRAKQVSVTRKVEVRLMEPTAEQRNSY